MTGVPQRPSSPPARTGRDQEPVPGGRPGNGAARAIPAPWPLPATLSDGERAPGALTTHPPPPRPEAAPGLRQPLLHPAPPLTPAAPEPVPVPGPRTHPSPEPAAPHQISRVSGSGPPTRLQKCPRRRRRRALSIPHPSLLFFRKRPASRLPRQAEAPATRPSPSSAPAGGTPLLARPPRRPSSPAGVSPAGSAGQGAPPTSPAVRPAGPRPAAASGARGSARPAGLGRERRQHTGQPRASPRHPGPGARALPRSRGGRLGGGARFRSARAPGAPPAPLPPGPGVGGGTRGRRTANWQLRTDSWRPPGPGPRPELGTGAGGRGGGEGRGPRLEGRAGARARDTHCSRR